MESLYSALLGAGLPSIACIVLCWLVWRQLTSDAAARKRLEEKVSDLETEKISKLESRLDTHIKADRSLELLTAQVSRALETNAGQASDIRSNKEYIDNLREDLQSHIRECTMRRGG